MYTRQIIRHLSTTRASLEGKFVFDPKKRPRLVLPAAVKASIEHQMATTEDRRYTRAEQDPNREMKAEKTIEPPRSVNAIIERLLDDGNRKSRRTSELMEEGLRLKASMQSRPLPMEQNIRGIKMAEIARELGPTTHPDDLESAAAARLRKLENQWQPVNFDRATSWAYLLTQSPRDYAVAAKIMREIQERNSDYKPKTLFDFGSGLGSCIWACNEVFGVMNEIVAVESSPDCRIVSQAILATPRFTDDEDYPNPCMPGGLFYRLNLPATNDLNYDLVTCCFTLSEMPDAKTRLSLIDNLWKKTQGYLIVAEHGNNVGFQIVSEVRDYLTQLSQLSTEGRAQAGLEGHVFSPCPHDGACPRYFMCTSPCNFAVKYKLFQVKQILADIKGRVYSDKFCYVVFRKGKADMEEHRYPRIVEEPLRRQKHVVCRMCTNRGKLEEVVVSPRQAGVPDSRVLYRYAKSLHWGNRFKVHVEDAEPKKSFKEQMRRKKEEKEKGLHNTIHDELS